MSFSALIWTSSCDFRVFYWKMAMKNESSLDEEDVEAV